ncbi:PREDICTED: ubiquinol-cytochrome-c reductase complex assembly factor 1 [Nicrophorus vespilloides]|uniref:Ubiquinol-cytochrome-c reductase complex assembly factor 1 n=1 Tax=Nicrophorus vespilloides TaxID=110193 RepID=A0ABM1M0M7_NICVS|nr:PREDICTED: ubiquinol-cytochrome-c reductase complex assembly factor 1 [Nicrophorus vespilloides]
MSACTAYINLLKVPQRCVLLRQCLRNTSSTAFSHNQKCLVAMTNKQYMSTVQSKSIIANREEEPSLLTRVLKKLPFFGVDRTKLNLVGFMMYESIADGINYGEFFEEFSLPDTFYSWFVVTELHLWMLTVRCMAEGDDGRLVRNRMVEALWTDVGLRVKKIGAANPAGMRMQVAELSEQLQAALIAYDEGLQSDDVVLAGALWRRMYQQNDVDPEHLEALIKYIRRQVRLLDSKAKVDLFRTTKMTIWEPSSEKL